MTAYFKKNISELVLLLIGYFITLIIVGIFKIQIISAPLPEIMVSSANLSGYISMIISSVFSIIIIGLIIYVIYFSCILLGFNLKEENLIESFNYVIYVFIIIEVIRFIYTLYSLPSEISQINFDPDTYILSIKNTTWFSVDSILKYVTLILGSVIFIISLYNQGYKKIFTLSILFLVLLFGFYISTFDFMNNIK